MAKEKKEKRFVKIHSEHFGSVEIWVDKRTGVNYLFKTCGNAGGVCPLIDAEGRPVVTPVSVEEKGFFD